MSFPFRPRLSRDGFVLVVALGVLAVMTLLLLALMQGASHQVRSAENDAAFAQEKMLADSAVALVIGQIQQASTQPNQTWISQPGLLRTYGLTASRTPTASYKLYSTATLAEMTDTSGTLGFIASDVPADWNSSAKINLYTDLNAPQQTTGLMGLPGNLIYPVLDPEAVTSVEGVKIDAGHSVEMPVQWLYQLQDGTLGPASGGTKANPIVGRMAFWTDDETCKININTAAGGSPWNTPHANSTDDVAWSTTQPASGEFSRYPGHAALVSLAPAFLTGTLSPQQLLGLSPRYGWGGSELGAKTTTPGQTIPAKTDRLYGSLDELCFGATTSSGQRDANPITPAQLEQARFVLTAHSNAPETTMLGEPRFAIWPVADAAQDSTRTTADDRAIASAATVGTRDYFFQRHNALSATDDLDNSTAWGQSNTQLFNDLVTRGGLTLPGYGTTFTQKYSGAKWPQLMLEIIDYIRGLNAIDPSPAPFVPYAAGDSTGLGRAFIVPLTATYGTGATALRGLGRCPTLSSLTVVFYVCGFGFDDKAPDIDYEATPDLDGSDWKSRFDLQSPTNRWSHVNSELIRAFVVPCTFHPGCAYPEVSDACDIEIDGLNGIQLQSVPDPTKVSDFQFPTSTNSALLGTPRKVLLDRAWGGNDGPVPWRATGELLAQQTTSTYPFAGVNSFKLPFSSSIQYSPTSKTLAQPLPIPSITFTGTTVTVHIRDAGQNTLQTLTVNLPTFTMPAPGIDQEGDHADGSTPDTSSSGWNAIKAPFVPPSYYMNLRNRLLATQRSRPFMIQPGDISRSVEANTDLRVIASLATVPATFFSPHPHYLIQGDSAAHNLRFADGMSAWGATGFNQPIKSAPYATNPTTATGTEWITGNSISLGGGWSTSAACSTPTTASASASVAMDSAQTPGDWDTGPGFSPDGAQINLPDAGTSLDPDTAYFSLASGKIGATTRFSPNALVASPVIFGSLPAGIDPATSMNSEPWRTLLFCPNPAANFCATPPTAITPGMHPGFATPPDYLLLDNFWMPVIEPYALSTCMATAGKINLNEQIAPFTYLHRDTAFYALLDSLRIPAIPVSMANPYKTAGPAIGSIWQPVDKETTIAALDKRFAAGSVDAYLSESEICTVPLTPLMSPPVTDPVGFWTGSNGAGRLTGDNLRELPYAQLYGRLTTRSNSYTVHVRVQVLKKLSGDPQQNVWKEGTDLVLGDWRGAYEIERYLDSAAKAPTAGQPLSPYRFRIVSSHRFAP